MKKIYIYLLINIFYFNDSLKAQCFLPYVEYNLWGLLNDSLHEVLPPKYDYLKNYNDDFWIYRKGFYYGILNSSFHELTPPDFSVIYWIDKQKYLVLQNDKFILKYWQDTLEVTFEVDTIYQAFDNFIHVEVNDKQGILNYRKEWKIPPIYEEVKTNGKDIIIFENQQYFYVDSTNKKTILEGFEEANFFSEGLAVVKKDELFGFINVKGQWVTNKEFLNAQGFQENFAPVEKNHRWGFINKNYQLTIPYIYDFVYPFNYGKAMVQFKGKWGVISTTGKVLIPLNYDEIYLFENHNFIVRNKNLWGIMNAQQEWIIPPSFIDFKKFHCHYWIFYYEDKSFAIVNHHGEIVWKNL